MATLPKDVKALASEGVVPMASATVPTGFTSLTGCGNGSAAALPLGMCIPSSGMYLMFTEASTGGVNSVSVSAYSDGACATTAQFSAVAFSGSCSTTDNSFSVGPMTSTIASIPSGAGVAEK